MREVAVGMVPVSMPALKPGAVIHGPKAMTDALHEQGIKLILWQIPAIKVPESPHPQHEADRAHYEASGFVEVTEYARDAMKRLGCDE